MTDLSFLIDTSAPLLVLMFCFHLSVSSQFCLTWVQKLSVSLRLLLNAYGIMIIIIYLTPETAPGKPASQSEHLWFTLIFTAFHLWSLLGSIDGGENSLNVLLEAKPLSAHLETNLWPWGYRRSGSPAALVSHAGRKSRTGTCVQPQQFSFIYIIASCSDYQARALITCRLTVSTSGVHDNSSSGHFSVPSSASRQLPRMHLSSWRSDLATSSCSRTDWSHRWRRWAI